jgi:multiple sugar transport system permease protein
LKRRERWLESAFPILLILPVLALFTVTNLYPVAYAIILSFQRRTPWDLVGQWVGLHNYDVVLNGPEFWASLTRGFVFGFGSVAVQILAGLLTALVVRQRFRGKPIIVTLVLVPYIVPTFSTALIMRWIFNDMYGVANYVLFSLGFVQSYASFFGDISRAMPTLIIANSWQYAMFVTLIFLARMMTINPNLYEMAEVLGASAFRKFRDITLPSIKGVFLLVILLRSIWMFNKFDIVYLLTRGGPLSSTTTLPILTYTKAFEGQQFGIGAAIATLTFLVLAVFATTYFVVLKPEKEIVT